VKNIRKTIFMDRIYAARNSLDSVLSNFTYDQMGIKLDENAWTVKDTISHILWYENEMVNVLKVRALEGSAWWEKSLEDRNEMIFSAGKDEELGSILERETQTFKALLDLLEGLDESDLNDPAAFKSMPAEWQPWSVIASNTYEHYQEHISQLEEMLKGLSDKPLSN
jgi:hypothetical protein